MNKPSALFTWIIAAVAVFPNLSALVVAVSYASGFGSAIPWIILNGVLFAVWSIVGARVVPYALGKK